MTCIPGDLLSRIYKGKGVYLRMLFKDKRVYKNAFSYQTNLRDTESALLSHEMREKKCLCFYFQLMKKGVTCSEVTV